MISNMLSTLIYFFVRSAVICTSVLLLNISPLQAAACSPGIGGTGNHDSREIGGTGKQANRKGIGGTGKQANRKGIGGTGKQANRKGIGGTGKQASRKGIGGTGKQIVEGSGIGGTGIIGTISSIPDSYSICVSGIKVTRKPTTSIHVNNKRSSFKNLRVGQVVSIHAHNNGKSITASRINVNYNLAGNIEFINARDYRFMAAGQSVLLHKSIRHKIKLIKTGRRIVVSGLRKSNGTIVATAINISTAQRKQNNVRINGRLSKTNDNQYYLYGLPIKVAKNKYSKLAHNKQVTVYGSFTANGFSLKKLDIHAQLPFNGRFHKLIIEGYLAKSTLPHAFSLNGANISITKKTSIFGAPKEQLVTDSRIHAAIWLDSNSRMSARAIRIDHDRFEQREQEKPSRKERKQKSKKEDSSDDLNSKDEAEHDNDDKDSDDKDRDDDSKQKDDDGEAPEPPEPPES